MGTICSGKDTFAEILKEDYGFTVIDLSAIMKLDPKIGKFYVTESLHSIFYKFI